MYLILQAHPSITVQFFGSAQGAFYIFPSVIFKDCDPFDPRLR